MKYVALILSGSLFFACGDKEESLQQKNGEDTAVGTQSADTGAKTGSDTIQAVEQPIVFNDIPRTKAVNELLKYFIAKYSVNYKEIHPDELKVYVLDRFGCDKKYKIYLEKKVPVEDRGEKLFPVAVIRAYIYTDSAQCANAVNNWFNCFGANCEMVQPGQTASIRSSPGLYILNEENIICLDHQPMYRKNNWKNMYADLKKLFVSRRSKVIEVGPGGELVWVQ